MAPAEERVVFAFDDGGEEDGGIRYDNVLGRVLIGSCWCADAGLTYDLLA